MPDIGPLSPNRQVSISYPDVPSDMVSKLNDLITAINTTSSHLNGSSARVQTFMGQANGAVQNVATTSNGKATEALVETWFYSLSDGNQAHTGMSGVASHLNAATTTLNENLQTLKNGMATLETLKSNGGYASAMQADDIQNQMNSLTGTLNNIGLALDGAAQLINALNSNWPMACATGFIPGSGYYPTFAPNAFNNTIMHMSGGAGAGMSSAAGQRIVSALGDQEEAELLILFAEEHNVDLNEVAALLEKGESPNTIVQWLGEGKALKGAENVLNQGVPASQVSQWVDQGLNLNGINTLLNKGISADAINAGLSKVDAQGWAGISKNIRKNMATAIKDWGNNAGSTEPYNNLEQLPALKNNGPFTKFRIDNTNTGRLNELRVIVDRYGNMWYSDGHYQTTGKIIPIPWSFIIQSLG